VLAALIIDNWRNETAAAPTAAAAVPPAFLFLRAFSSFVQRPLLFRLGWAGLLAVRSLCTRWPIRPLLIRLPLRADRLLLLCCVGGPFPLAADRLAVGEPDPPAADRLPWRPFPLAADRLVVGEPDPPAADRPPVGDLFRLLLIGLSLTSLIRLLLIGLSLASLFFLLL